MVHRCAQLNLDATTTTWDFDNKLYLIYVSTILLHKYIEGIYWYTYICLHIWIGSLKLWKPPPSQAGQNPGWSLWRALKEFITNLVWVVQNEPRSAQKTLKVNNFLYIFIIQSQITSHARKHPYTLPYLYISTIYVEIYTPNAWFICKVKHHQPPGVDPWSHCHRACAVVWYHLKWKTLKNTHMYTCNYMYPCMHVSVPMSLSMICALRYAHMHGYM